MNDSLTCAKALLQEKGYTCVLCCGNTVFESRERGVKPLLDFLQSEQDFDGFSAADRVVGKAAAFLYALLGVREVYAQVLSLPAKAVFERFQISVTYASLTDAIRNRNGDGFCPMEQAVWSIDDPRQALDAIQAARRALLRKA